MPLINIILILVLVGFALWMINNFIPMAGSIRSLLNAVVFIVVLIWVLRMFGVISSLPIRIPRLSS